MRNLLITMTQEEINRRNVLIAEFMGWKAIEGTEGNCFTHPDTWDVLALWDDKNKASDFNYHESWDKLMRCIGKISSECEDPEELDELKYSLLGNCIEYAWLFVTDYLAEKRDI